MHEYDTALKLLVQRASGLVARELGIHVKRWLNVELPKVQNPRVDLLAETPLHMESKMTLAALSFAYTIVDVRDLDGERLLESSEVGDNIIAVLARFRDEKEMVRKILNKITELAPGEREEAFRTLLIISGLRQMEELVKQEATNVPVLNDIMDHKVIGPAIKQGLEQGRQEGRQEEALWVLRRVIEKRFGPVPGWVEAQLKIQSVTQLEELAVRAIDAPNLEHLFPGAQTLL